MAPSPKSSWQTRIWTSWWIWLNQGCGVGVEPGVGLEYREIDSGKKYRLSNAIFACLCWKTVQFVEVCCVGPTILYMKEDLVEAILFFKSELEFVIYHRPTEKKNERNRK